MTAFTATATAPARRPLWLLTSAVAGVLLIACANIANLLLAHGVAREKELAVRAALGAGGRRLATPVLADAFLLAGLSALVGLAIAQLCIFLYNANGGLVQASWVAIRLDGRALLFVVGVTGFVALLTGMVPAMRAAGMAAGDQLKDQGQTLTGRRLSRAGRAAIAVQVALSCALAAGTGQMVESVRNLYAHDFGEAPEQVWTARFLLDVQRWSSPGRWGRFFTDLEREVDGLPGVEAMALVSHRPATPTPRAALEIEGVAAPREGDRPSVRWSLISPGFFAVLGRPVLQGRDFSRQDDAEAVPVVLINRSLARRHFPGKNPVGRRIRVDNPRFGEGWATIVGVVPDLYLGLDYFSERIDSDHPEGVYYPLSQRPQPGGYLLLRSRLPASTLGTAVRQRFARLDPELPPVDEASLAECIATATNDYRMVRTVLAVFSVAGLVLVAVGLYGLAAFVAGQRRRELAIRTALGASAPSLVKVVVRDGVLPLAVGAGLGVGLAVATSRFLRSLLFGVAPADFASLAGTLLALFLVAGAACFEPALRALGVNPVAALRGE